MTISKTLFLGAVALSLCACQTTSAIPSPSDTLLANIDSSAISPLGSATTLLNSSDPTCLKFYQNTTSFVSLPADLNVGVGRPSFGAGLMKTIVLGTLAGVASGGVAAIGIQSSFLEAAVIGTASQVTYNAGSTVYDKIVSPTTPEPVVPAVPALEPLQEIQNAAAAIGCPAPDTAAIAALKLSQAVN